VACPFTGLTVRKHPRLHQRFLHNLGERLVLRHAISDVLVVRLEGGGVPAAEQQVHGLALRLPAEDHLVVVLAEAGLGELDGR
jgi:hypothetical protein